MGRKWRVAFVITFRLIVGATFLYSGFAKAVDPWGFMYKIQEYLEVWGMAWVPREFDLCIGAAISMLEFTIGVSLILGCLRRITTMVALAIMAFMLPLTIYIAIANPVADCGCFGDALAISNTATMIKNIALTAMLVFLYFYNHKVEPIVTPILQWIPVLVSVLMCIVLSTVGYLSQPLVDFRPYKVGTPLLAHADEESDGGLKMVYERDGLRKTFALDELPDSTWTYIGREGDEMADSRVLTIYDGNDDITDWIISDQGPQLLMIVSNPAYHNRARASMANRLYEYMDENGGDMIGLLPLSGEELAAWRTIARPKYDTYTVEPTVLKEIARGDAALVYLNDGIVQWKYNLYNLPGDFNTTDSNASIESMRPIERSKILPALLLIWLAAILFTVIVSQIRRINSLKHHKKSNIIS